MSSSCPECGAPVPPGGSCRDHFHALLLLEAEIPGVPGSILHFYAVATYALQHPDSMNYTADALAGLQQHAFLVHRVRGDLEADDDLWSIEPIGRSRAGDRHQRRSQRDGDGFAARDHRPVRRRRRQSSASIAQRSWSRQRPASSMRSRPIHRITFFAAPAWNQGSWIDPMRPSSRNRLI